MATDFLQDFLKEQAQVAYSSAGKYLSRELDKQRAEDDTSAKPATPATVAQRDLGIPDWMKWGAIAAAIVVGLVVFNKFLR